MWIYFLILLVPALLACADAGTSRASRRPQSVIVWLIIVAIITGLRFRVGGDWVTYLGYLERSQIASFGESLALADPLYECLNWLASSIDQGIALVNSVVAALFYLGVYRILADVNYRWIAIAAGTPYLFIVVGMGYSRQAMALGFVMMGYAALVQGRSLAFATYALIGSGCHKSALVVLPLALIVSGRNPVRRVGFASLAAVVGYDVFVADYADKLQQVYLVEQLTTSQGAGIRLAMNGICGVGILFLRKTATQSSLDHRFWLWLGFASALLWAVFIALGDYSTAFDRMSIYCMPIQMYFAQLLVKSSSIHSRATVSVFLGLVYFLVLLIWLLFAAHSQYWLPYQSIVFA